MAPASRRIVIDASVARSAGPEHAVYPTAIHCRDFLQTMLESRHRMVLTPDIAAEWGRHQSGFARKWRVRMYSRKLVCWPTIDPDAALKEKALACCREGKMREAVRKDFLLIEAALCTDHTISSLDDTVRGHLASNCSRMKEIAGIAWVNPDKIEAEDPIGWLKRGAGNEAKRLLMNFR